jgi:hypothetical protein
MEDQGDLPLPQIKFDANGDLIIEPSLTSSKMTLIFIRENGDFKIES